MFNRTVKQIFSLCTFLVAVSPINAESAKTKSNPVEDVERTLDTFHDAASKADGKTYFSLFAPEGVFIGTDATERWSVEEFKKIC